MVSGGAAAKLARGCLVGIWMGAVLASDVRGEGERSQDNVMGLLREMRGRAAHGHDIRLADLESAYARSLDPDERRLLSLGLGAHYLDENPRLSLQYLAVAAAGRQGSDPLEAVARYYMAEAHFRGGSVLEAAAICASLLAGERTDRVDSWVRRVHSLLIESLASAGQDGRMLEEFKSYAQRFSLSRRQEALARHAVMALERRGDIAPATEILEELARGYPATEDSRWAFHRLEDRQCRVGAPGAYEFSLKLLSRISRNVTMDPGLESFIVSALGGQVIDERGVRRQLSVLEKVEFLYRARLYVPALAMVKEAYQGEQGRPRTADSLQTLAGLTFEYGRLSLRLGQPTEASRHFSRFVDEFPSHSLYPRAVEHLGDSLRMLGQPLAAAKQYEEAIKLKPSDTLRWQHFWSLYRGHDYAEALKLLTTPGAVTPREGDPPLTLTYWKARLLEHLGEKEQEEAKAIFQDILAKEGGSYYAMLVAIYHPELAREGAASPALVASAGSENPGLALAAKRLAVATPNPGRMWPAAVADGEPDSLRSVRDLARIGLNDMAATVLAALKWVGFNDPRAFAAVNRLSDHLGDYRPTRNLRYMGFTSLRTVPPTWSGIQQHQVENAAEWQVYYPIAHQDIVLQLAAKLKLSPFFILSIMRAESQYNKEARSGVGALGLMQLMPYTAVRIAAELKDEHFDAHDLGDPTLNISYGAYYLDKLLRYYDGNLFLAAAAYNGGPHVVNLWLNGCRDCTADEFADSIPYRETRHYVREVMRNFATYTHIYANQPGFVALPAVPSIKSDLTDMY